MFTVFDLNIAAVLMVPVPHLGRSCSNRICVICQGEITAETAAQVLGTNAGI